MWALRGLAEGVGGGADGVRPSLGFLAVPPRLRLLLPASDPRPESAGPAGFAHKDGRTRKEDRARLAWGASRPRPVSFPCRPQERSWRGVDHWAALSLLPKLGGPGAHVLGKLAFSTRAPGQWCGPSRGEGVLQLGRPGLRKARFADGSQSRGDVWSEQRVWLTVSPFVGQGLRAWPQGVDRRVCRAHADVQPTGGTARV